MGSSGAVLGTARFALDPAFVVAPVDRRLFGSFVEHMGRCVYTGIYEPDHPTADAEGFRQDVADLTRELGVSVVRYPGGNFVSSYRWEDGVGPRAERPTRLDLAWRGIEPNDVGLNDFMTWARRTNVEPMMAVNLGTRGVQEAVDLIEYANHPEGTYFSDLRRSHGAKDPHDIRLWCLGNELDGPWQMGRKTPYEYGRLAAETAKAMRMVDPRIELVAVGSSNSKMPTFGAWEREVLEQTYEHVDYISLHDYYEEREGDLASFLATSVDMDAFIAAVVATADSVGARLRSPKRLKLSFDEWNVWYQAKFVGQQNLDWTFARDLIEDEFNAADAVVVGSLLITLLRHADRVGVACQAQLVNVIAPIRTEAGGTAWRQTIFHPFAHTARLARGTVLRVEPRGPQVDTAAFGPVPALDAVATYDEATGEVVVLAVNRSTSSSLALDVDLRGIEAAHGALRLVEHLVLADDDVRATNSAAHPDRVTAREGRDASTQDGRLAAVLPPVSWTALRLQPSSSQTSTPTFASSQS
ncbi:alpha-N-arabinofuranosidase [Angustibacter sp. Root456]|uniref:arabinosylfuranosidase ArfA n=1 Tax=Angustibacter sp. Root456 TaxID=1736539 RepID=UPI000A57C41D|nr:alpha-N-arabinofuranosidase [Angustibacter sp. Root456]